MIKEIFKFKNHALRISKNSQRSQTAILMLHGFPAEKHNGTPFEKNSDIADFLANHFEIDVILPHYNGLDHNLHNEFNFVHSIEDTLNLLEELKGSYKSISIIGHSWGGLVAWNCFKSVPEFISKAVLLSPFLSIPNQEELRIFVQELILETPAKSRANLLDLYLDEFEIVKTKFSPLVCFQPTGISQNQVHILQALQDTVVPPSVADHFMATQVISIGRIDIDTDHGFLENRGVVMGHLVRILEQSDTN